MITISRKVFIRSFLQVLSFAVGTVFFASCSYEKSDPQSLFEITSICKLYEPSSYEQLQGLVNQAREEGKKICLVGAGKSQGGQTVYPDSSAYRISLCNLNKLVMLDAVEKRVVVQAGMTWWQLQEFLIPHNLAVKAMQSFNNFSIGGSLGVNVHGQDVVANPLIRTVESCKLLCADGNIVVVSRTQNQELFAMAIGGYGLVGIIIEVTLNLTDNTLMERKARVIDAEDLAQHFSQEVDNNPHVEFYSARYSLGALNRLEKALVVTYEKTDKEFKESGRVKAASKSSKVQQFMLQKGFSALEKSKLVKELRFPLEGMYFKQPKMMTRNNFMGFSTEQSLPHDGSGAMYILQEYFIPYDQVNNFIARLKVLIKKFKINLLNLTARHVNADTESMLSYSPRESCALVLYMSQKKSYKDYESTLVWTRALIDVALACNGTYYLPYQLLATHEQFEKAYPKFKNFVALKKYYDPQEIFTNQLYHMYACTE